jgi:hypothetical protein
MLKREVKNQSLSGDNCANNKSQAKSWLQTGEMPAIPFFMGRWNVGRLYILHKYIFDNKINPNSNQFKLFKPCLNTKIM